MKRGRAMIRIDWNIFSEKFALNAPLQFEFLAYCLFAYEFNIQYGLFRYRNHPGIETAPIDYNGKKIGFQAKFYSTNLSDNKVDIINSIKKAKIAHPELTDIILYTQQDHTYNTRGKSKPPAYLVEINECAKTLNLVIDWRTHSHIELMLTKTENKYLAEYFFLSNGGIFKFVRALSERTNNIFSSIHSAIQFSSKMIKIDRKSTIEILEKCNSNKVTLVYGIGGIGKTAVLKDFHQAQTVQIPFFILKTPEILDFFSPEKIAAGWDSSIQDFLDIHSDFSEKIFVIDSAEKMVDLSTTEPIQYFISELLKNHWTVIFTTRTLYLEDLKFLLHERFNAQIETIELAPILESELYRLAHENGFCLPSNHRITELLRLPFYLNAYLQAYSILENISDIDKFKNTLWHQQIDGGIYGNTASVMLCALIRQKISDGVYYIFPDLIYKNDIQQLIDREIIGFDPENNAYYIVHDVYEEWALTKIIQQAFVSGQYNDFFERIGCELPIRRAYRLWLSEKLHSDANSLSAFVSYAINMPGYWKDETLIAIMLSPYASSFFNAFSDLLLKNDHGLLLQVTKLILIACRDFNNNVAFKNIIEQYRGHQYLFTTPLGNGWMAIISFLYENRELFSYEEIAPFLPLLKDWCGHQSTGKTTKYAALLALSFYSKYQTLEHRYTQKDNQHLLLHIITSGAAEIKNELSRIVDDYLEKSDISPVDIYYDLCNKVLAHPLEHMNFIRNLPEHTRKIAFRFWLSPKRLPWESDSLHRIENALGLSPHFSNKYFPASAYHTPIYWLLGVDFVGTLDFIIKFVNATIDSFAKEMPEELEKITLAISPNRHVEQYICPGIWNMHRGTGSPVMPYLLQSIHMGLEKFLLENYSDDNVDTIEKILILILVKSKSASLSAVVTSVLLKHPDSFFNAARILFSSGTAISYDYIRAAFEDRNKSHYSIGLGWNLRNQIYEQERLKTCEDDFRKKSLEYLMLYYQIIYSGTDDVEFNRRKKVIENILDTYYARYENLSESEKFFLARVDARKMKWQECQIEGSQKVYRPIPELPVKLREISEQAAIDTETKYKGIGLSLWAENKFAGKPIPESAKKYESSPRLALAEFHAILEQDSSDENLFLIERIPIYTASSFIIYHRDILNSDEIAICEKIILEHAAKFITPDYCIQISDGADAALAALPHLYAESEQKSDIILILLLALFNETHIGMAGRFCDYAFKSIRDYAVIDATFAKRIFHLYLIVHGIYESFLNKFLEDHNRERGTFWRLFIEQNEKALINALSSPIETVDIANCSDKTLCNAVLLINSESKDVDYFNFIKTTISSSFFYLYHEEPEKDWRHQNFKQHDFQERLSFERNLASIILSFEPSQVVTIAKSFIEIPIAFSRSSFLDTLILTEDQKGEYNNFWSFWNGIYPIVKDVVVKDYGTNYRDRNQMIRSFLLAFPYWGKEAKNWKSLKDREKNFYSKIISELGSHPDVLYSVAKFLTEIGTPFQNEGVFWLRDIINKSPKINSKELEQNILYYLELFMQCFFIEKRDTIKKNTAYKDAVLTILNFLIEHNSVAGYLIRESIL